VKTEETLEFATKSYKARFYST